MYEFNQCQLKKIKWNIEIDKFKKKYIIYSVTHHLLMDGGLSRAFLFVSILCNSHQSHITHFFSFHPPIFSVGFLSPFTFSRVPFLHIFRLFFWLSDPPICLFNLFTPFTISTTLAILLNHVFFSCIISAILLFLVYPAVQMISFVYFLFELNVMFLDLFLYCWTNQTKNIF